VWPAIQISEKLLWWQVSISSSSEASSRNFSIFEIGQSGVERTGIDEFGMHTFTAEISILSI
jgi:hypothetical protein